MTTLRAFAVISMLIALPALAAAQDSGQNAFHFWFRRDGACVACAKMPPPGKEGVFPQGAGIDVMFNGFNQETGQHWQNQEVQSYAVTYKYELNGIDHFTTRTAGGHAASVVIKPYLTSDLNNAQILSITVVATYTAGSITKTINSPHPFQVY